MIDEPTVVPVSPGAAIARLSQTVGALEKHSQIAKVLDPETTTHLRAHRDALITALENNEPAPIEAALREAQNALRKAYETLSQPGLWSAEEAASVFAALRFPDPLQRRVHAVDVSTVIATFSCPEKQIFTTISFEDAPGSVAYWLREIRVIESSGEILNDPLIENYAPVFHRVRLGPGVRRFQIESRDNSRIATSEEFEITIPSSL